MTLSIKSLIQSAIANQVKISHFPGAIKVGAPSDLTTDVVEQIKEQFGDLFLNDANWLIFASPQSNQRFENKEKQKFAELVARAFGKESLPTSQVNEFIVSEESEDSEDSEDASDKEDELIFFFIKVTTK